MGYTRSMLGTDEIVTYHHVASFTPVIDADTAEAAVRVRAMHNGVGPRAGRFWELNWTLAKDVLKRGDEVIARGVRDWAVRPDGISTRISITLDRRSADPGTTGTTTATEVVRARTREAP